MVWTAALTLRGKSEFERLKRIRMFTRQVLLTALNIRSELCKQKKPFKKKESL